MSAPGNERRIELLNVDWAYDGYDGDYHPTYFLRNKTIAIKIGGIATVKVYGRVNGVRTQLLPDVTKDTLVQNEMLIDEMKAHISDYTSGPVSVYILGE